MQQVFKSIKTAIEDAQLAKQEYESYIRFFKGTSSEATSVLDFVQSPLLDKIRAFMIKCKSYSHTPLTGFILLGLQGMFIVLLIQALIK